MTRSLPKYYTQLYKEKSPRLRAFGARSVQRKALLRLIHEAVDGVAVTAPQSEQHGGQPLRWGGDWRLQEGGVRDFCEKRVRAFIAEILRTRQGDHELLVVFATKEAGHAGFEHLRVDTLSSVRSDFLGVDTQLMGEFQCLADHPPGGYFGCFVRVEAQGKLRSEAAD